jgi:predicted RNase H-like HicB family nuclease
MKLGFSSGMKFTAVIQKDEKMYVARCLEIDVVSQGRRVDTALKNLKEALGLYLEEMGLPEDFNDNDVFITHFSIAN